VLVGRDGRATAERATLAGMRTILLLTPILAPPLRSGEERL